MTYAVYGPARKQSQVLICVTDVDSAKQEARAQRQKWQDKGWDNYANRVTIRHVKTANGLRALAADCRDLAEHLEACSMLRSSGAVGLGLEAKSARYRNLARSLETSAHFEENPDYLERYANL